MTAHSGGGVEQEFRGQPRLGSRDIVFRRPGPLGRLGGPTGGKTSMATYNLSQGQLESLLEGAVSKGTENAIISALKEAGDFGCGHDKIGVEIQTTSGNFTASPLDKLFLDLGAFNQINLTTQGGLVISGGDGATTITDLGPGGDTLIGGAGAETLKVTQGNNFLEAGSGRNTLVGGSGHDFLQGGGQSVLDGGGGATTLFGGLSMGSGDDHDNHGHEHGGGDDDHGHGHGGWGDDHGQGHDWGHNHDGGGGGGGPSDTLLAGSGDDFLQVLHGSNLMVAGSGHDTLTGGDGNDSMYGGSGMDTMNLTGGNTWVQGGMGADTVNVGLFGNDSIYGGASTTVDSQQASFMVKHEETHHGVTTITFANHQELTLQNVTINFSDGVSDNV
jgi:Ca2+-binding RTX toxin-like protein